VNTYPEAGMVESDRPASALEQAMTLTEDALKDLEHITGVLREKLAPALGPGSPNVPEDNLAVARPVTSSYVSRANEQADRIRLTWRMLSEIHDRLEV